MKNSPLDVAAIAEALSEQASALIAKAVAPLLARIAELEARSLMQGEKGDTGQPGERGLQGVEGLPGRDGRDGLPGVPGRDGIDGAAGLNGKDGAAGIDGKDGAPGQDGKPGLKYCGVFQDGHPYELGHVVTYGGSAWHANQDTTDKPGISKAWTLCVKQGRDGKDGKDGKQGERGTAGRDAMRAYPNGP